MIVSFSVSNFRSFHHEETFTLTASNRLAGHHDDHLVPIPDSDQSILRLGVLYGANGAGKSNLFKALSYLRELALNPRPKGSSTSREPFRLGDDTEEATSFDLQFLASGTLYRFGLKVNDYRVTEEWLSTMSRGKETSLYQRTTSPEGKVSVEIEGLAHESKKLASLATIGGPQNQTFFATTAATLEISDWGLTFFSAWKWLAIDLQLVSPDETIAVARFLTEYPEFTRFASAFLKAASTGIDHLQVAKQELSEEEFSNLLARYPLETYLEGTSERTNGLHDMRLDDGTEVLIEQGEDQRYYKVTIRSAHVGQSGSVVPFELREESDGTKRLLDLMPALQVLQRSSSVYFIDEIDRSLHPKLVWEFVHFFLASQGKHNSQLILTTHDTNLLDLELLRRDEIWFAEKDQHSATHLYSLTDFQVRKDLQIRKHYMEGRFGAVPFMGDIERLIPKDAPKA